jgi:hypothetical protein
MNPLGLLPKIWQSTAVDTSGPPPAEPVVPLAHMRDRAPSGDYALAADYLLESTRLRRRETIFNAYVSEVGTRRVEVDFSLPADLEGPEPCYVPVAFLPKRPVAPCLDVCDASERILAVPTKRENMALTQLAITELASSGRLDLQDPRQSTELIREVIGRKPLPARVSRFLLMRREPGVEPIFETLALLEDHYLLWVPVAGAPGSQHHVVVRRSERREKEPLLRRKRISRTVPVTTAAGRVKVRLRQPVGRRTIDFSAGLRRVLIAFALHPVEAGVREFEAARFASCHLRFDAPAGFLVRNLRVGVSDGSARPGEEETVEEINHDDPHIVVQGLDEDVGHVHLSKTSNPRRIYLTVALGLRGGNTTLWMLATTLTATLLWLIHHHSSFGPPRFQNKQIVAAALLVGPAFASAWSLRAEGGELLRTHLAGARVLLLSSAALSVATALALADVLPFGLSRYDLISFYASISYFIAVVLILAWLLSARPVWGLFRDFLFTQSRNLLIVTLAGAATFVVGFHETLGLRVSGAILLVVSLCLPVVAANTVAEPLRAARTLYRPLAGFGSPPVIFAAGYFLGFYTNRFDEHVLRLICVVTGATLILFALVGFFLADTANMEDADV